METPTPRPKPQPPKTLPNSKSRNVGKKSSYINTNDVDPNNLPPINMKSPDGTRVITIKNAEKGQELAKKGWTITTDPKTPYERTDRMTDRPLQNNPDLKEMLEKMRTSTNVTPTYRNSPRFKNRSRKNNKEKK